MLEEPSIIVSEDELDLPTVTLGRKVPSFTDEEIWNFAGDRGVFSDSPTYFKYAFDILVHRDGVLLYRMKPKKEWFIKIKTKDEKNLFEGVVFHDAMERFIVREYDNNDTIVIMNTHDPNGEEYDILENSCTVPYDRFKKYLDYNIPFDNFHTELKKYNKEVSEHECNDINADTVIQKKQKMNE